MCGDWGHSWGPLEEHVKMLDWMLGYQRLVHPRLSQEERAAAQAEIGRRIAALEGAEPRARLAAAEALLGLPGIETRRDTGTLYARWFSARYDLAAAQDDPVEKHEALSCLAEDERVRKCTPADRRRLSRELRQMRMKSPVKAEWTARRAYMQVKAIEDAAGGSKQKLTQAARSYALIARKYGATRYGQKAAEDTKRLASELGIPIR